MKKERILMLWSGGIDSTANLKSYLEKTDYEVIAHHIYYNCGVGLRQDKEIDSISKLVPKLKEIRDFTYVESSCKYQSFPRILDITMIFTLSIPVAIRYGCKKIVIGFVDDIRENQKEYISNTKTHLDTISKSFCILNHYEDIAPEVHVSEFIDSKLNYIISLGDIINDVWFCRGYKHKKTKKTILTDIPCGRCHTCKHVARSIDALAEMCVNKNNGEQVVENIYESNKEQVVLGIGYD